MKATCRPFSIATSAAISATIVLPEPTSPCSRRFIGCGRCMSVTISRMTVFWSPVSLNGRIRRTASRVSSVTTTGAPLALGVGAAPPQHDPELEQEELLEDQPAVRRRSERVQLGDRGVRGRESAPARARRAVRSASAAARTAAGSGSGSCRRHRLQRLVHERALHLRGQLPGLLVDGHDAPGVDGSFDAVVSSFDSFVLFDRLVDRESRTAGSASAGRATSARACRRG